MTITAIVTVAIVTIFVLQQLQPYRVFGTENDITLNHIFQLANVPRRRVLSEGSHSLRGKRAENPSKLLSIGAQEMLDQQRNVTAPVSQRRQGYTNNLDAGEEVVAKRSRLNFSLEAPVRGTNGTYFL